MYLLGAEEDYTKSTTTTATENRIGPYDQVPIAPKSVEIVMVTLSPTASDKELRLSSSSTHSFFTARWTTPTSVIQHLLNLISLHGFPKMQRNLKQLY